jgi:hypothetical protein
VEHASSEWVFLDHSLIVLAAVNNSSMVLGTEHTFPRAVYDIIDDDGVFFLQIAGL